MFVGVLAIPQRWSYTDCNNLIKFINDICNNRDITLCPGITSVHLEQYTTGTEIKARFYLREQLIGININQKYYYELQTSTWIILLIQMSRS